jgi:hypothetical protein
VVFLKEGDKSVDAVVQNQSMSSVQQDLLSGYLLKSKTPQFTRVAELLLTFGFLEEAIWVLRQGTTEFPTLTAARLQLAKCLYLRGLIPQAESEIVLIESSQPKSISVLKVKLRIAVFYGRTDSAKVLLKLLSEMIPDDLVMKKTKVALAMDEFMQAKSALASESTFLAELVSTANSDAKPMLGSYESSLELIKKLRDQSLTSVVQAKSDVQNLGSSLGSADTVLMDLNSFVPVPMAAAARLGSHTNEDLKIVFLNKLLVGLESLG